MSVCRRGKLINPQRLHSRRPSQALGDYIYIYIYIYIHIYMYLYIYICIYIYGSASSPAPPSQALGNRKAADAALRDAGIAEAGVRAFLLQTIALTIARVVCHILSPPNPSCYMPSTILNICVCVCVCMHISPYILSPLNPPVVCRTPPNPPVVCHRQRQYRVKANPHPHRL